MNENKKSFGVLIDSEFKGVAPVEVVGRFNGEYYSHLKDLREVINCRCVDYLQLGTVCGGKYALDMWYDDEFLLKCEPGELRTGFVVNGREFIGNAVIMASNLETGETIGLEEVWEDIDYVNFVIDVVRKAVRFKDVCAKEPKFEFVSF